jgi:RNA-directed DNA polymerase
MDRCQQQQVRHVLEPERDARFEARSYGFRPGRGCPDAIEAHLQLVHQAVAKRVWALDADLAAAFGRTNHDRGPPISRAWK